MGRKRGKTQAGGPRTAHYTPPEIGHREEVEPLARASEGFVVHEKGGGVVTIDYTTMAVSWADPLLREMRGLAFDADTGAIAARPLHKFFEWGSQGVDAHTAGPPEAAAPTEKADGTLFFPAATRAGTVWCTRAGVTAHAKAAAASAGKTALAGAAALMRPIEPGGEPLTPSFEWVGGDPIVVHHPPGPPLRLLALRGNRSGRYVTGEALVEAIERAEQETGATIAATPGVRAPWTPQWWPEHPTWEAIEDAVEHAPGGTEGIVMTWPDGLRSKHKSGWYAALHGIYESPYHPRYQLVACIERERDEVLARVRNPDVRDPLGAVWDAVQARLASESARLEALIDTLERTHGADQKGFALGIKAEIADPVVHSVAFRARALRARGEQADIAAMMRECASRKARHERTRSALLAPEGMLAGVRLLEREAQNEQKRRTALT